MKSLTSIPPKDLPGPITLNLSDHVSNCNNDDELRQLVKSIDTGLLRPLLSKGAKTPIITPSPRIGLRTIENLHSLGLVSATRSDHPRPTSG
ncbi:hypothetical protein N7486_000653 [Penicillium sp. IBT 16267x]|nr:hypothetical protein N7486_000653 [Penicillium sp. IBT 16267x]